MKKVRFEWENDSVLKLQGELAFANAHDCLQQGSRIISSKLPLQIDLQDLQHKDSSCIACLLAWVRLSHSLDADICFIGMSPSMHALVVLYQLEECITVAL